MLLTFRIRGVQTFIWYLESIYITGQILKQLVMANHIHPWCLNRGPLNICRIRAWSDMYGSVKVLRDWWQLSGSMGSACEWQLSKWHACYLVITGYCVWNHNRTTIKIRVYTRQRTVIYFLHLHAKTTPFYSFCLTPCNPSFQCPRLRMYMKPHIGLNL